MPTPTKFTADRREVIYEALSVGASLRTAAAIAGIDQKTLLRWLKDGEDAKEGSTKREFYERCQEKQAEPRLGALKIVKQAWVDKPELAWKFLERREPGFAPPQPGVTQKPQGPVVINLTLDSGQPVRQIIEGEIVEDEPKEVESGG